MCGSDDPPPTPPMATARANVWEQRQRAAMDEEARAAQAARDDAERVRKTGEFNTNLDAAYTRGLGYAQDRVGQLGLNYDEFKDPIISEYQRQRGSIPQLDSNPGAYFGDDLVERVLGRVRDTRRNQYGQQVNQFAGDGFADKAVGNDFDDSELNNIYDEQYGDASSQLQRAFARGNLSPIGMSLAQKQLDSQGRAGKSRLQDLGGGVLSKYRTELGDIGSRAKTNAGGYELGGNFNPDDYKQQIESKKGEFGQRLTGDIRDATKGEQIFNVDDIIGKAGVSQGVYNPASSAATSSSSPIFGALSARKKRNTSSAGAF